MLQAMSSWAKKMGIFCSLDNITLLIFTMHMTHHPSHGKAAAKDNKTMKRLLSAVFLLVTAFLIWRPIVSIEERGSSLQQNHEEALVVSVSEEFDPIYSENFQRLELELLNGGESIEVKNATSSLVNAIEYEVGDRVVVVSTRNVSGDLQYFVADHVRRPALIWLFGLFLATVLLVNRKKGLLSLLSLGFSFLVIFRFILPLILTGFNPILTAVLGSLLLLPSTFYLSHGFNKKTTVALLGTLTALILTIFLAMLFTNFAHLTGIASEEAGFLKLYLGEGLDTRGLLLAGIMIGALGVLDDVCITQASIVNELKASQPKIPSFELFKRSMAVGGDHISSVVNTLVLVYAGAALPLMLLFFDGGQSAGQVLNYEYMAEEVVRSLVGSIGLIAAVPLTSLLAVWTEKKVN